MWGRWAGGALRCATPGASCRANEARSQEQNARCAPHAPPRCRPMRAQVE
ncbi:hypothetical protein MYA_3144 [Burkholderia sp. KJ006]|nr:hypothetical protein MYA_3144 [Burkholderia sp. KJ006]